jgi:hypothetical protein
VKKPSKAKKAKRVVVKAVRKQTVKVLPTVPPVAAAPAVKPVEDPKPRLVTINVNARYLHSYRGVPE